MISTHALREEGDAISTSPSVAIALFLPTPSARRATVKGPQMRYLFYGFLPTPSARRATDQIDALLSQIQFLPTPSARRATGGSGYWRNGGRISTHALREEGDTVIDPDLASRLDISTHALREEGDIYNTIPENYIIDISTHALREEGDMIPHRPGRAYLISTHALREEGDVRRRHDVMTINWISTHALREEGDLLSND